MSDFNDFNEDRTDVLRQRTALDNHIEGGLWYINCFSLLLSIDYIYDMWYHVYTYNSGKWIKNSTRLNIFKAQNVVLKYTIYLIGFIIFYLYFCQYVIQNPEVSWRTSQIVSTDSLDAYEVKGLQLLVCHLDLVTTDLWWTSKKLSQQIF